MGGIGELVRNAAEGERGCYKIFPRDLLGGEDHEDLPEVARPRPGRDKLSGPLEEGGVVALGQLDPDRVVFEAFALGESEGTGSEDVEDLPCGARAGGGLV